MQIMQIIPVMHILQIKFIMPIMYCSGNMEDHGLEMSPSSHRQIAPELEGACQQQTFEVQAEHSV